MPESADQIYKNADDIVAETIAALQAAIPDANIGPDSIFRIWAVVDAASKEGIYLGMQLNHDDMFIQTANALALQRYGEMYGRSQKAGTLATGTVRFEGAGGEYIPMGVEVAAPRPSLEDALAFITTVDGVIPNPGLPSAPLTADNGVGIMAAGTYEYVVTFVTAEGETEAGTPSIPLVQVINRKIALTVIPSGGTGTAARKLYRRVDGGAWGLVTTIADNVTTVYNDNTAIPGVQMPPDVSTAERLTLAATATDVGSDYNVAIGTITDISDSQGADLAGVVNLVAFTAGSDPEDIETFRSELLKRVRAPQSGSPPDLESWAEEIDGVSSATAFKNEDLSGTPTPGTVTVRIVGPNGSIPDGDKVDEVQAALEARDLANITILVGTFDAVLEDVTVDVDLSSGFALDDVEAQVQQAIIEYIESVPVGGTIYVAGIYHAVFGLAGIETLDVTLPVADVTLTSTQKAVADTITVT